MNAWELFRYSVSDLRHRWMTAAMNVVAVGISVVYVLVLGFYAASTHQYQQRLVEEAGPAEKIVLTTPHASDIEQWFGPSRIEEIRRMPGVDCAFPCVELSGRVSLDDREPTPVTLESTAPGDPTTSPLRMSWGGSVEAGPGDQAVLGQTLFEKLGGVLTTDGPVPDRLIVCIERSRSRVPEIHRQTVAVVGLLRHQPDDRIHLPAELAASLDRWVSHRLDCLNPHGSPTAGLVVPFCDAYVPEEGVGRVVGDCRSLGVTAERVGAVEIYVPDQPVMFQIDRWDGASLTRHDVWQILEASYQAGAQIDTPLLWMIWDGDTINRELQHTWLCSPPGVFPELAARLLTLGLFAEPAPASVGRRLVRYRIRPDEQSGRPLDDRLMGQLRLTQPTFAAVRPHLAFDATLMHSTEPLPVAASDAADPAQYGVDLSAGDWVGDDDPQQIVLPRHSLGSQRIGDIVHLVIQRPSESDVPQQAVVALRIVGIVGRGNAVVPVPMALDILRWQQGDLEYDVERAVFYQVPPDVEQNRHVRCTVIADGLHSVPPLVRAFQHRGYRTIDQLTAHEGLVRMAGVLVLLVGLAVLGCVLNGAITVLVSTLMSIRSKTFEIGILRAHGFRDGEVLAIFLLQAVVLASFALLLASTAVYVAEPPIRGLICQAMGIRPGMFSVASLFTPSSVWLFTLAAGIALVFSVVGVAIPAAWACRLSPVEALRRRE
jgi:hypothetical protein